MTILVEKIAGQLLRDFMQEQFFQIAHMTQTGFYAKNNLPANTALGYLEDRQTTNIYDLPIREKRRWRLIYHCRRLVLFLAAPFCPSHSPPELTAVFLWTHECFDEKTGYGCGLYKRRDESPFTIVGGDAGVGFDFRYLVEQKITVSIFSNVTNGEENLRKVISDFFDKEA